MIVPEIDRLIESAERAGADPEYLRGLKLRLSTAWRARAGPT
jgi:hypothetical protein